MPNPPLGIVVSISVAGQTQLSYAHGCQAQGGCCTVGGACIDITANSPIYIMLVIVGSVGAMLFTVYGGFERRKRPGAIFNVFS